MLKTAPTYAGPGLYQRMRRSKERSNAQIFLRVARGTCAYDGAREKIEIRQPSGAAWQNNDHAQYRQIICAQLCDYLAPWGRCQWVGCHSQRIYFLPSKLSTNLTKPSERLRAKPRSLLKACSRFPIARFPKAGVPWLIALKTIGTRLLEQIWRLT